jgi:hypothetical protein
VIADDRRVNIFIACFPKSGSTHVSEVLRRATGLPLIGAVQFYGHNEQDLYEPALRVLATTSSVTQQHVKGTGVNVELMLRYGIRPVVLLRDVFDALVSLHDHFEREGTATPVGFVHREYTSLAFEERMRFLVHLHLPWYLHFLMSWREAGERIEVLWTSYEEVFADQVPAFRRILAFYDLAVEDAVIERAIETAGRGRRFNVGVAGRGREMVSAECREAALRIGAAWGAGADLMERIGLRP